MFDPLMVGDALLLAVVFLLAWFAPSHGKRVQQQAARIVALHLQSPTRQILAIGLFALIARAALLPWLGAPVPQHHDEFSLMLQAQTYLAGRLINPTPEFWQHFEEIHINLLPEYGSMYFPGRGLPLAAGLWLAGNAWLGVWLSFVLMAMAAVWMLRGWVSPPLALLGGVLVVLRLGIFSYWVNSFWGGAFTALGAMLVVGALPRLLQRPTVFLGTVLGVGVLILVTTRPYEGALLCLPLAIYILLAMVRRTNLAVLAVLTKVGLPAVLFAALGGAALMVHNEATTHDAFTTAYTVNRQAYAVTPAFLIAPPVVGERRGPPYFQEFYAWENEQYAHRDNPVKMLWAALVKLYYAFNFQVGVILAPAFLAGLWASRRDLLLPITTAFFFAGFLLETWGFPHYTAPIFPVILVLIMRGFSWLANWRLGGRDFGPALTRYMPAAIALGLSLPVLALTTGWPHIQSDQSRKPCCALLESSFRSEMEAQLKAEPGRDIVLVASDQGRPTHLPILYNEPDIAASDIVWAHDLDPASNRRLLRHYANRSVWTLRWSADGKPHLRRQSGPAELAAPDAG